ncbi:MAG: hypothetical protein HYZ53_23335 [Planctomycetes bacterium]|nr:hypothetical protein [Planctomycetota bacterium]
MPLFDFFARAGRAKAPPSLDEVRREAARLDIREHQCVARIEKLEQEKEEIFARGSKLKSPVRRKQLARLFRQKKLQLVDAEREHMRLSKEAMTLSVVRRALERQRDAKEGVMGLLSRVREEELARLLEDDKITTDLYLDKLNQLVGAAETPLDDVLKEVGKEGMELIDIWQRMDEGEIESAEEGIKLAEKAVKEKRDRRPESEGTT